MLLVLIMHLLFINSSFNSVCPLPIQLIMICKFLSNVIFMYGLGMWRVWVRRGGVQGLGGETGRKETTGET